MFILFSRNLKSRRKNTLATHVVHLALAHSGSAMSVVTPGQRLVMEFRKVGDDYTDGTT